MKNFAILSVFLIGAAFGQDDVCKNDFQTAVQCLKTGFQAAGGMKELQTEFRTKVNGCFQSAGCAAPNYDADALADGGFAKTIVEKFESLSSSQKNCIREKIRDRIRGKIEQCLNKPIPDWAKQAWENFREENQMTDAQKTEFKQAIKAKLNIAKATRDCANKNALSQCLIDASAQAGKEACGRAQTCASGASGSCKDKANKLRQDVCGCIDKAKAEMESRMQSADSNPMAFISNMRNQGGDMPGELKECGIDTQAIMQEAIIKKCAEAGVSTAGSFNAVIIRCIPRLRQSMGDMKNSMGQLKDYMEQHGGAKEAFCDCTL